MTSKTKESVAAVEENNAAAEMEAVMEKFRAQVESIHQETRAQVESINQETQAKLESINKKVQAELESIKRKEYARQGTNDESKDDEGADVEEGGAKRESGQADKKDTDINDATNQSGNANANEKSFVGNGGADQGGSVCDEDIKKKLFVNATHQLIYVDEIVLDDDNRDPYKANCWERFLALSVIGFQFLAYIALYEYVLSSIN